MTKACFEGVSRTYPGMDRPAVDRLDLDIRDGELLVLVGPSGCGKSTALRMLAGLEPVDRGRILLGERDITHMPARERDIAMVFQSYALYPHMTVAENIGFHLQLQHVGLEETRRRVAGTAELLGITELLETRPSKLSGGQRQRVAMGRALIRDPQVFLMDEPLSNLDAKLRVRMRSEIGSLQKRLGTTTMYVTHDQTEAMTLGGRVAVQRDGVLLQCGPPMDLFDKPLNMFVAGFIGSPAMNMLPSRVCGSDAVFGPLRHRLSATQVSALTSPEVTIGVRPEAWRIVESGGLDAVVDIVESLGPETIVRCTEAHTGSIIVVRAKGRQSIRPRDRLSLLPASCESHVFDTATGLRVGLR
jgi:multiple sugar transport system ATP-binding protein